MTKETENKIDDANRVSRRQFVKTIAAASVAAPLMVSAQTPPAATKQAPAPPNPKPTPAAPPKISPVAEAYGEVARARFGDKLTAEQLTQVKEDLEGNVRTAERLRAFKLQNGDEPDFIFSA